MTVDPWGENPEGADSTGLAWRTPQEGGIPAEDWLSGPPDERGPASGGGGRFWRRDRTRRASGDHGRIDLRNTWQVVAGSMLVPLGVVLILMAWYGAAHTHYVQQQIPYLVSGSFAGLGCMVLGGLLYWAHWIYRIYDQADHHQEEQLQLMQQTLRALVERLPAAGSNGWAPHEGVPPGGATPEARATAGSELIGSSHPGASQPQSSASDGTSYVVTPTGSVYHHPGCPIVAHHSEGLRVLGSGAVADMEPCRICLQGGDPRG